MANTDMLELKGRSDEVNSKKGDISWTLDRLHSALTAAVFSLPRSTFKQLRMASRSTWLSCQDENGGRYTLMVGPCQDRWQAQPGTVVVAISLRDKNGNHVRELISCDAWPAETVITIHPILDELRDLCVAWCKEWGCAEKFEETLSRPKMWRQVPYRTAYE